LERSLVSLDGDGNRLSSNGGSELIRIISSNILVASDSHNSLTLFGIVAFSINSSVPVIVFGCEFCRLNIPKGPIGVATIATMVEVSSTRAINKLFFGQGD